LDAGGERVKDAGALKKYLEGVYPLCLGVSEISDDIVAVFALQLLEAQDKQIEFLKKRLRKAIDLGEYRKVIDQLVDVSGIS
jgi:hypothetical protein